MSKIEKDIERLKSKPNQISNILKLLDEWRIL